MNLTAQRSMKPLEFSHVFSRYGKQAVIVGPRQPCNRMVHITTGVMYDFDWIWKVESVLYFDELRLGSGDIREHAEGMLEDARSKLQQVAVAGFFQGAQPPMAPIDFNSWNDEEVDA